MTVLVPLLQSSPRNFPLCSLTAWATLLVRSSLLSVIMSRVTLCWAVKAQGQGHSLERVARWEHNLRSSGMLELSIRSSEGNNILVIVGSSQSVAVISVMITNIRLFWCGETGRILPGDVKSPNINANLFVLIFNNRP